MLNCHILELQFLENILYKYNQPLIPVQAVSGHVNELITCVCLWTLLSVA